MNYKFNNLYTKIYRGYIRGEYGAPRIPTRNEIVRKMEEFTTTENVPITDNNRMTSFQIGEIQRKFSSIIDDIDILFDSIESESVDILDQLTHSLKEHRGTKRELSRINSRTKDINNGQLGEEYLKYNFTETFEDLTYINTQRSDPVFTDAGVFSIARGSDQILSLSHYYGTKLEWSIIENYAQIEEQLYVNSTDAATMLDQKDPRQLIYRIRTNRPTRLRTSIAFQLTPDGRKVEINGVTLDLDSSISKGWVRLYYRDEYKWLDVKTASIQQVKSDRVIYNFPNTFASHIKIEFIKDVPDVPSSNHYYYILNNLAIFRGSSKRKAILYSKPITFESYDREAPIISRIEASGDIFVPPTCEANLYVAQDVKINGQFKDINDESVYSDSANAVKFDPSASGFVYLSDVWNSESTVSGIEIYRGLDFNWKKLKSFNNAGERVPSVIEFNNTRLKPKIDNSIFAISSWYTFGDLDYTGIYDLSGWVNTSNSQWAQMEPLVNSGILVSGVTITGVGWIQDSNGNLNPDVYSNPDFSGQWIGFGSGAGYPFSYQIPNLDRTFRFNEYDRSIDGWWRPMSDSVTPTGIKSELKGSGNQVNPDYLSYLPDFHFNGLDFYKIYKFGLDENVIEPTIRLYSYQQRPVISESGYYPASFIWNYKSRWTDEIGVKQNARMANPSSTFDNYVIPVPATSLRPNEEYIVDAIEEVRIHGTSVVLDTSEYFTVPIGSNRIQGINLSGLSATTNYPTSGIAFDYKYRYRVKNEYLSSWTGYAITTAGAESPIITIANQNVNDVRNIPLIKSVVITNLDTGETNNISEEGGLFNVKLNREDSTKEAHFKITIYCASDSNTGFCANQWVPHEGIKSKTLTVSPGIKLVSRLKPIAIVDLSTLIYDTPINNDGRAALLEEENGEKFLVVKQPSKDIFPGYYYSSLEKKYYEDYSSRIENIGHWVRSGITESGEIVYTTGSDASGIVYDFNRTDLDLTWNNGATLPDYPNDTGIPFYPHHSTFAYPINIDRQRNATIHLEEGYIDPRAPYNVGRVGSTSWYSWLQTNYSDQVEQWNDSNELTISDINRGFLFYDTAENLSTFYSITYRNIIGVSDIHKRFLYKLELLSDNQENLTPIVKSLRFIVNDRL